MSHEHRAKLCLTVINVLVVVGTDPRGRGEHDYIDDHEGDDTPCEDDCGRVLRYVVLEGTDNQEEEPSNTTSGTAGVDTTDMLDEAGEEDTPPKGGPL